MGERTWDIIVKSLEAEGVKYVFGLPGNPMALYDSLYDSNIEPILVRHEGSGAFMAFAYSKLTREPGVCFGSPGPGVTNMVSGVLEAYSGCQPMIMLGASVGLQNEGKGAFQETPQMEIFKPITKWSHRILRPDRASWAMNQAFSQASNGQPGPVYIDVPFNVGLKETEKASYVKSRRPIRVKPSFEAVKDCADLLLRSERPVIVAGGGAYMSNSGSEIRSLAELVGIPVLTTPSGRGLIPEDHPLSVGLVGLYRTRIGKKVYHNSDLLISLGSRNEEFQTAAWNYYPEGAKLVQVDIAFSELGRNWFPDIPIVADVKLFLRDLLTVLKEKITGKPLDEMPRIKTIIEEKERFLQDISEECLGTKDVKSKRVVFEANRVFGRNTVLVNENGSQDLWSYYSPYYRVLDLDGCVAPAEQTCMGLGVAGAIGAKLAAPDRDVICTTGDGAFQMCMKELPTAVQYKVPATWIVLNNYSLGWIKLHQWANEERYISVDYEAQPDFKLIAEASGCYGEKITKADEIRTSLESAKKKNQEGIPAVLDFIVEPMDFPQGFKEFHPNIFI
jgi:acetolactate synthase-1/2/3 large subunit